MCQSVGQLKPRLMALCSATRRLGEGSQLEEEVANLQKQQTLLMGKAAEKQSTLESLLALWQRYRKQQKACVCSRASCVCVCVCRENLEEVHLNI